MCSLPQGWEVKKLGEVCQFFNGKAHEKHIVPNGNFVVVNSKFISTDGSIRKFIAQQMSPLFRGDIAMVMSDVPNGKALAKCYIVNEDDKYSLNQRICAIRTTEFSILFLYYQLNRHPYLLAFNNGENQTNLRKNDILNCPLCKPPLPEQKRIVAILDQAFTAIDQAKANTEKNLKNARELFQSKLQETFANGKLKIDTGEWEEKKLGEVCQYDKNKNTRTDLPYVGLENIESDTGKFIGSKKPSQVKSSTFYFSSQHILYGRLRPYLNKVLLPDFSGHCSTEIFPIKASKLTVREFLFYWFMMDATVSKINATWTGARMPRANMKEVINFYIGIPPLLEQKQIVQKLDIVSTETKKLETIYQQKITCLDELKKSILQKAFNGEL